MENENFLRFDDFIVAIYLTKYKTREQAKKEIYEYIEVFYNAKRIHSSNGYLSPLEYEQMYYKKLAS